MYKYIIDRIREQIGNSTHYWWANSSFFRTYILHSELQWVIIILLCTITAYYIPQFPCEILVCKIYVTFSTIVSIQLHDNAIRAVSTQRPNEIEWREYGTLCTVYIMYVFVCLFWQIVEKEHAHTHTHTMCTRCIQLHTLICWKN